MTAVETAVALGVSPASVYTAIKRGELTAKQTRNGVDVAPSSVRAFHKVLIARGLAHCRSVEEVECLLATIEGGG